MRFFVHKLGCPKNDVDADYIAARLIADGHELVSDPEEAESIIVNTCGFIRDAKEESIEELLRLAQLKKHGRLRVLYATGCLTQRYGNEMLKEMPELDGAFGIGVLDSLAAAVSSASCLSEVARCESDRLTYLDWSSRHIADNLPHAYLKISDGCNRGCTFCAIPGIRGQYRSRSIASIVSEAEFLAENGKKELILVSQDATLWGCGLPGSPNLINLLRELDRVDGVEWIRVMYLYPGPLVEKLVTCLSSDCRTLKYFDLPLQHINDDILSAMGRMTTRREIERLIDLIRQKLLDAVIRTTFLVGFPGETKEQFRELMEFVEQTRFERLGVFMFSAEEGTPAEKLPNQIPEEIKYDRMDRLMCLQREIALEKNNSLIGTTVQVIIDTVEEGKPAAARTRSDCPDIDQEVCVVGDSLRAGDICMVRIDGVDGYDLLGTRVME